MTTPRIEEILFRFRLDFPYTYDQVSEDMKETHETFLSKALTEAHQAGIDEAVEEYQKKFVGGGPDGDDIAVMEWLRTLLTKHEAAVLEREAQYEELLSAVETKYEGETRHQTALKYILEAEDRSTQPQSTADHLRGE